MKSEDTISTIELKRLLITLKEHSPDTKIRFREIGKMWSSNFSQIIQITDQELVVMQSDERHELSFTPIKNIVQFELEDRFQNFEPLNHYNVKFSLAEA